MSTGAANMLNLHFVLSQMIVEHEFIALQHQMRGCLWGRLS